jgi:hypothetical protein
MDYQQSLAGASGGPECQGSKKKTFDEEMLDAETALGKEKEEMKKLDQKFEERTYKLAQMIGIQQSGQILP